MKKMWVLAVLAMLCTCASGGKPAAESSGAANLDAAIQQASAEINESLPAGTKVALLNFNSGSPVFSDYVLEEMSIALVQARKLTVVDRKEIDLIRNEMNFQMSGDVSDESAQQIGAMLGAQSIVSGSLVSMGDAYRFRTKVINVNSATIETSSSISVRDDPQMRHLLGQSGNSATQIVTALGGAQATTQTPSAPAVSATPAQATAPAMPAYKIGDTGPAGGLVFYDKGNNNGGWRYLEAAPEDLPRALMWASETFNTEQCRERIVGKGKSNTQAIMVEAAKLGGGFGWAVQACVTYSLNDFNDWFLPSQDELNYMYGHLHMQELGDFKNERYWSSTANFYGYASSPMFEDFSNGYQNIMSPNDRCRVRPIRQF